ncbi:alpha/beta hydrolase [Cupriavidus sp. AU9028]|uniref:alpha/beta hydrolase n=1 Tax=Cupriavidus sp. AU9028 TaxID=2871157 RepID=UPI001C95EF60|nr:alpha/beta fold hydrolase [Cupriavidus sp. AU9028]MBY4895950.1 lysophospholipase [Cupriavidus sp. AU9028]
MATLAVMAPGGALAALQDRFLYYPSKASLDELVSGRLQAWPGAAEFRGLLAEPAGPAHGTVIVLHGNAGHAGHRQLYADALVAQGLRVILAEYPGYGPRDGALGEASLVADAQRTVELAHAQFGAPLLLIGESLGAGVAAATAAGERQREKIAGIMLITPWDRLAHIASHHYAWLPTSWLLRDRYDSVRNLAGFAGPVLVVIAERDRIVPARFGRALYDSLGPRRQLRVVAGAEHNDWFGRVDAPWWSEAMAFLLGNEGG